MTYMHANALDSSSKIVSSFIMGDWLHLFREFTIGKLVDIFMFALNLTTLLIDTKGSAI